MTCAARDRKGNLSIVRLREVITPLCRMHEAMLVRP